MMKRAKSIATISFFSIAFISSLFIANVFAAKAEWEMIKKLEEAERPLPQEVIVRPKVEYKAGGLRDPFQAPLVEKIIQGEKVQVPEVEIPPSSLVVQGVIWGGRFPQAIINNKVVKVGDYIDGARIISIDKNSITIFSQGRQYKLAPSVAGTIPYKEP